MASLNTFENVILKIRNILRCTTPSVTGMDSMRHICLYLLSRYMTADKVDRFQIPQKFCWESLMNMIRNQEGGVQFAKDLLYHPHEECLILHFDRIFGTEDFKITVRSLDDHRQIMEELDKVDLDQIEMAKDILGWVYEQHLSTGSSKGRDTGQFFTNRLVCEYMIELCNPRLLEDGSPETVCDPSVGTGGFLTTYIKYYKRHSVDWSQYADCLHGCDTDSKVACIARMNIFLETHGYYSKNLLNHNSVYQDLPSEQYDIILANIPFGIKGLKHNLCCKRLCDLNIKGNACEPLFMQLIMLSLKPGGRCAVIVPDGMINNVSKMHNQTRKYLLDNFELKRVIKIKSKTFTNTAVTPSILFFENSGRSTEQVEFWEITKSDKGTVAENLVLTLRLDELDKNYMLDASRYQESEQVSSSQYPVAMMGEVCVHKNGKVLSGEERAEEGEYDVMGGGMSYVGKTNAYNREADTITISKSGASAGFVMYHTQRYWAGDCFTVEPKDVSVLSVKYLYYYLKINNRLFFDKTNGSTIPHCKWDDVKDVGIILPPRRVQDEIVSTLDRMYSTELKLPERIMDLVLADPSGATLEPVVEAQKMIRKSEQMVEMIKRQMEAIVKGVTYAHRQEMVKVGDIAFGKRYPQHDTSHGMESGKYVFHTGGMNTRLFVDEPDINESVVIINRTNGAGKCNVFFDSQCSVARQTIVMSCEEEVTTRYLYYWICANKETVERGYIGGNHKNISLDYVKSLLIAVPSLEVQRQVVGRLDALQAQVQSLERLGQQSADNARFILESYL